MIVRIKKFPAETMGIIFALVFSALLLISQIIMPQHRVVLIPLWISLIVFIGLLISLIVVYLFSYNQAIGWRRGAELFIMLAVMCSSLSDLFWIFTMVSSIIIIIGTFLEKKLSLKNPILLLWFLLCLVASLSSFVAIESSFLSFGATFGLLIYTMIFIAVYHQNFLQERGEEFLQRIGVLFSFSVVVTVIFSLWHYFFPYKISVLIFQFQPKTGYGNSFGMASIYGEWPTHSSAFLVLVFWVLVALRQYCSLTKVRRWILNIGCLFALTGTLATLSRNAFLFVIVSCFLYLFILFIKKKSKIIFASILGMGVFFTGIFLFFINHFEKWRALLTNPLQQQTIAERINQYQFAWQQLKEIPHPFLGIGLMNFGAYYRRIQQDETLADYLHQLFLSILLEMGYIGFIVFLVLLVFIAKNIIKNYKNSVNNMVFVVVFLSWICVGMFDNWLYFLWSSTLFMIFIALGSKQGDIK